MNTRFATASLAMTAALLLAPVTAAQPDPLPDEPYEAFDLDGIELSEEERAELEELWETARSWGVGALKEKVPEAREELARRGARAAKFLVGKLDEEYSLARRAHETIFTKMGPPAIGLLAAGLESDNETVRRTVIGVLSKIRHEDAADALAAFIDRDREREIEDEAMQFRAVMALSILGDARAVELIGPYRKHEKESRRLQYCVVMEKFRPQAGFEPLVGLLGDEFFSVRYAAQEALAAVGKPAVAPLMEMLETTGDVIAGNHAAMALGEIGSRRAWRALEARLAAEDWSVRGYAVEALSKIDARKAGRLFSRSLAGESHPFVRGKLREAEERVE